MVACLQSQYLVRRGMKIALSMDYILRRVLTKTKGGESRKKKIDRQIDRQIHLQPQNANDYPLRNSELYPWVKCLIEIEADPFLVE